MDLDKAFSSAIHLKVIRFFHENQAALDTPRGVATWISEERSKVKKALENLVSLKILVAHRSTSTTGYSYTRDSKIIAAIAKRLKKNTA